MKLNFNQELKNFKGEPITENGRNVIFTDICIRSLLHTSEGVTLSGEAQYKRYNLASKIYNSSKANTKVELKPGEVLLIKDSVASLYKTLVTGAVYDLFNNYTPAKPANIENIAIPIPETIPENLPNN